MAKSKKEQLPKGGIKEKSKPKKAPKKDFHCPYCSQELTKVQLYDEYFCETCLRYVHRHLLGLPQKTRIAITCPTCKGEPEYVHDYNKHYCHNCKKYLSIDEIEKKPVALVTEKTPAPPPADFYLSPPPVTKTKGYLCKNCNGGLQFIYQYQRWYCSKCNEYV